MSINFLDSRVFRGILGGAKKSVLATYEPVRGALLWAYKPWIERGAK